MAVTSRWTCGGTMLCVRRRRDRYSARVLATAPVGGLRALRVVHSIVMSNNSMSNDSNVSKCHGLGTPARHRDRAGTPHVYKSQESSHPTLRDPRGSSTSYMYCRTFHRKNSYTLRPALTSDESL